MKRALLLSLFFFQAVLSTASALVLYNPNAEGSTSAPADFAYWNNVVTFSNATGVYLGEGWILTANHVNTPATVAIDGQTKTVASSQQVLSADLKLLRLADWEALNLASINVYQGWQSTGSNVAIENGKTAYAIGYGYGAGTAITGGYNWDNTYQKRWGLVELGGSRYTLSGDSSNITSYFDRSLGDHAAAYAQGDSGGGVFYQDETGWHLGGIITHTSDTGNSYYDRNASAAGDQPGYGISQRLAGNYGLSIYRTTGIWAIADSTGTYNGTTWTEGSADSLRILAEGNLTLTANQSWALLETASPTHIDNSAQHTVEIGTVLTRGTSPLTLTGNFSIQALDVETGGEATLQDGTFTIDRLSNQIPSLKIKNANVSIATRGASLDTLTLENATFSHESTQVKNLRFLGQNTIINEAPFTLSIPGGAEETTYYSILATDSIEITAGASADTFGFRQGETATLLVEGNLIIGLNDLQTAQFVAENTTFSETASLTLDLWGDMSDTISFIGDGPLTLQGLLLVNTLGELAVSQFVLFTLEENISLSLLFENHDNGRFLTTDGKWSFSLTTQENTTTGLTEVSATNFQSTIPEPTTAGLVLLSLLWLWSLRTFRHQNGSCRGGLFQHQEN